MTAHVSWTEIPNFSTLLKTWEAYPHTRGGQDTIVYRAKVKLHGSCAGIRIDSDGTVTAFSRTAVLTEKDDLKGFCKWVMAQKEKWAELAQGILPDNSIVILGEWCGPGVIKGSTAISKTEKKIFAIFAVRAFDKNTKTESEEEDDLGEVYVTPDALIRFAATNDSYILPWYTDASGESKKYLIDVKNVDKLQSELDRLNEDVLAIEQNDPWVEETFGVKGGGEGLVLYPIYHKVGDYKTFTNLVFKAKGEKHQVIVKAKPAQIAPETAESAKAFAAMVLPEARLQQGADSVHKDGVNFSMKFLGDFLTWIKKDVVKECQNEMAASNLEEKVALRECETLARNWYIAKAKGV